MKSARCSSRAYDPCVSPPALRPRLVVVASSSVLLALFVSACHSADCSSWVSPCPSPYPVGAFCVTGDCKLDGVAGVCADGSCELGRGQTLTIPIAAFASRLAGIPDLRLSYDGDCPTCVADPEKATASLDGTAGVHVPHGPGGAVLVWRPFPAAPAVLSIRRDDGLASARVLLQFQDAACEDANPAPVCDAPP